MLRAVFLLHICSNYSQSGTQISHHTLLHTSRVRQISRNRFRGQIFQQPQTA